MYVQSVVYFMKNYQITFSTYVQLILFLSN